MADVIERREPVIINERDSDHDHAVVEDRSSVGTILLVLLAIIILAFLFTRFNPFAGSGGGGTTNVNVPTPTTSGQ
jgi:hypothetical protein